MADSVLAGKKQDLPFDLQTEEAQLAIQQAIAMELLKQGMEPKAPVLSVGGYPVGNWANITAAGEQMYNAKKQLTDVATRQGALAGQYNKQLAEALLNYSNIRFGRPPTYQETPDAGGAQQAEGPGGADVGGPAARESAFKMMQPGVRPDLVGAIKFAAGSRLPALQAIGAADIKEAPGGKEYLQYAKEYGGPGLGRFAATLDPTQLTPMPQYHQAGDVGVTTVGGVPVGSTPTETWNPMTLDPNTQLPIRVSQQTGKTEAVSQNYPTNVTTGWAAQSTKMVEESLKDAKLANEAIRGISQIEADLQNIPPGALGAVSDSKLFVDKLVETLGGKPIKWTPDLENVKGQFKQIMAQKIRLFAPVADKDVEIALSMIGGDFTKDGMAKMLSYLKQQSEGALANHQQLVEAYTSSLPEAERARALKMLTPYFQPKIIPPARGAAPTGGVPPGTPAGGAAWVGPSNSPWSAFTSDQLKAEFERQRKLQGR